MATVVWDYERAHGEDYVENVTVIRTEAAPYPSGWKYALHYGEVDGKTLLRYDNAHERTKGHERHTITDSERIEFPGMSVLHQRFKREIRTLPP